MHQEDRDDDVPTAAERELLGEVGGRHGLWNRDAEPRLLARGGENATFALADLIVRLGSDGEAVAREAALLEGLARATTVRVPVPLVHDPDRALLIYRKLPGVPLLRTGRRLEGGAATALADALADVLAALRSLPQAKALPIDDHPNVLWLEEAGQHYLAVKDHLDADQSAVIERFLNESPPPDRGVLVPQHNDLGTEHILVDAGGAVTGVIDWTDAACADPARDLGLLLRDLGDRVAFRVAGILDGPPTGDDRARVRFHARCKWLEDASYAQLDPEGRDAYAGNIAHTFRGTFRGLD